MKKHVKIKDFGFYGESIAERIDGGANDGCYYWESNDTRWMYDPQTDKTCHCGIGQGCFWTEWE